jgi:hypothetical protein
VDHLVSFLDAFAGQHQGARYVKTHRVRAPSVNA